MKLLHPFLHVLSMKWKDSNKMWVAAIEDNLMQNHV